MKRGRQPPEGRPESELPQAGTLVHVTSKTKVWKSPDSSSSNTNVVCQLKRGDLALVIGNTFDPEEGDWTWIVVGGSFGVVDPDFLERVNEG